METKEPEQVDTEEDRIANLRSMRFTLLEVEDIVRVKNILQGSGNDDINNNNNIKQ